MPKKTELDKPFEDEPQVAELYTKQENDNAVIVRRGYKHYGSKRKRIDVLVDFEMTVQRGTIYGLLGPSGAGKTSLLACLVGRRYLNSGEIWVLGGKPGTTYSCVPGRCVGYMPQELALFVEFTMKDMMLYFGWIYGMSLKNIEKRSLFLMELLDLKTRFRKIKNMSGGQQRRVSLAVALMHNPELLILDEPTVGVDPLLRQTIWSHLVDLVKKGRTTVIITTHYIEEARQAHTIGLMRRGRLLAEDSPDNLLKFYKTSSLEGVFLQLSSNQSPSPLSAPVLSKHSSIPVKYNKRFKGSHRGVNAQLKSHQLRALIHKNFLTLWRNPGIILFFLALPLVQVILFCTTIGGEPTNLLLVVVNDEVSELTTTKICPFSWGCHFSNLSCRYLHHLDATVVDFEYSASVNEARKEVELGNAWGVIYFNDQFSISTMMRQVSPTDENLKLSQIEVQLDTADHQINFMIQRDLMQSYLAFGKHLLRDCKQSEANLDYPVAIKEPIIGPEKPSFTDFTAPGIILTDKLINFSIIFFLSVGQTAITLISEKLEGMLDRTIVAGVTPSQILVGHIISQFIIMCSQVALVLFFALEVFRVRCIGSIFLLITLTLIVGVCGMSYGYVISAACDVERTAIEIALGSFYPCIIMSGVIWPIEGMHYGLRCLAYCTPLTFAIASIRAIMSKGWGLQMRTVYLGFLGPTAWITFFLIVVSLILRFKRL